MLPRLRSTIIGVNSFVEKFSDGTIYVTTDGKKEPINEALYQVFCEIAPPRESPPLHSQEELQLWRKTQSPESGEIWTLHLNVL